MADEAPVSFTASTQKLRLQGIAIFHDFGFYVLLWLGVMGIYLVRLAVAATGFDPEVLKIVHWMESATDVTLCGSFFGRIAIRAIRGR